MYYKMLLLGLTIFLCISCTQAVNPRYALVIGNSIYDKELKLNDLETPISDAESIRDKLRQLDFDVEESLNESHEELRNKIDAFYEKVHKADGNVLSVLYYAGHGVQVSIPSIPSEHYLLASNSSLDNITETAIGVQSMIPVLKSPADSLSHVIILDACRAMYFEDDTYMPPAEIEVQVSDSLRGLAPIRHSAATTSQNTLIAYSAESGKFAYDKKYKTNAEPSQEKENSVYTHFLKKHLLRNNTVGEIFKLVRADVSKETRSNKEAYPFEQITEEHVKINENIVLNPPLSEITSQPPDIVF